MATLSKVCVYCGSGSGNDPTYVESAIVLGQALAEAGIGLVYGGGSVGMMGVLARTVLDHGGQVTGIIPDFLETREKVFGDVTELIVTRDMHERKMLMFERAEAFVALPGGIGTLEETVEQMTWVQLGRHEKPILLANIAGFWQPLIDLIDHMTAEEFIQNGREIRPLVTDQAEEILPLLIEACAMREQSKIDLRADDERIRRL